MLEEYTGKSEKELKALAEEWKSGGRVSLWNSKPRESDEEKNEFYENMPVGYIADLHYNAIDNKRKYLKGINAMGLKVLDFGCGTGEFGLTLAGQGAKVDFFDLKTNAVGFLEYKIEKMNLSDSCRVLHSVESLSASYDIILCFDVLEHISKPSETFKMLESRLKNFGKFVLWTPLVIGLHGKYYSSPRQSDAEHIQEAWDDWGRQDMDNYIKDKYIISGYQLTKSSLRVMMLYNYNEGTTGDFVERAMKKYARVMRPVVSQNGEGLKTMVRQNKIDFILQVDSGGWVRIPRDVGCPVFCYSIDTFNKTEKVMESLKDFDLRFFAQKRFAVDPTRDSWLPLAVDPDVYHPINTFTAYDVAFCGTFLVRDSQSERNRSLKALTMAQYKRGLAFYLGRDYNSAACLKYNQARMVFNMGICNDINMRLFEAMGSGIACLYNEVDNLDELGFKPWEHYIPFKDESNVVKSVYLSINDKAKTDSIQARAFVEVLSRHTYEHRVKQIIKSAFPNLTIDK